MTSERDALAAQIRGVLYGDGHSYAQGRHLFREGVSLLVRAATLAGD